MSQIIKAASVLLAKASVPAELFIVRRAESLRFFGGFSAFPGGKVHSADRDLVSAPAESPHDRYITAARELFEPDLSRARAVVLDDDRVWIDRDLGVGADRSDLSFVRHPVSPPASF